MNLLVEMKGHRSLIDGSGGWFEVLPNNGPATTYKGARLGFYAETINLPWEYRIIEDTPEKVKVVLLVKNLSNAIYFEKMAND